MLKTKLILSGILTAVMIYVMIASGMPLKTEATPRGIVDLEFAGTKDKVSDILTAWQPTAGAGFDLINVAKMNIYLDYIFLIVYGWLFYNLCLLINFYMPAFDQYKFFFRSLPILAATADALENAFMLAALNGSYSPVGLRLMVVLAFLKLALIGIVALYCAGGIFTMAKNGKFSLD